jgi:phosphatidylglycerol:prolipoprotein diacylglycerol transferase
VIPYFPPLTLAFGGMSMSAFGIAAATALLIGYWITLWRARRTGLSEQLCSRYYLLGVLGGLFGGHLASLWNIERQTTAWDWVRIWNGQSVIGLTAGSLFVLLVACLHLRHRRMPVWAYVNVFAYAFPFTWAVVRMGCALVHDHIGRATTNVLGVRFPFGTRFDLGLLECLAAAILAGCFFATRATRRELFFPVLLLTAAIVRVAISKLCA